MADERMVAAGRVREGDEQARALFERRHDPSRVIALSDGVFAIIITLLVLDIHVPELTSGHSLTAALRDIRPSFVAFVISFIVAGMCWVAIWMYVTSRSQLLWQRLDDRQRRAGLALTGAPALGYLLATLVAGVASGVSLAIYGILPVLYFLGITLLRSGRKRNQEYADFT